MSLNWQYKIRSSKRQTAQEGREASKKLLSSEAGVAININQSYSAEAEEEPPDCILKLRYLKTVELMLDRKISSNLQSSTCNSEEFAGSKNMDNSESVSKLLSACTIGERLQSWYKSSSRSTDTSVESGELVPIQQQESTVDDDTDESVLGIAHFLDFSKIFQENSDDHDTACIAQQTIYSAN
eukprot:TRINITY_DN18255_c0_g1_i9.p3 TRINITY_DN18255_c0_g1~~TRINITY_DN18255_c0_g1_i9.p3  ORF type:complete len:183 (+),score=26.46 TRINITY_DN18255_c0_g1_i9:265-813(+)